MSDEATSCPSEKELRDFVASPLEGRQETVASHIFVCERCQKRVERFLYAGAKGLLTAGERAAVGSFVDAHCAPERSLDVRLNEFVSARQSAFFADGTSDWRMAASARTCSCDDERPEDVRFVFVSEEDVGPNDVWRAELEIPGTATGSDPLGIWISGRDGKPAGDGVFAIAGAVIPVEGGRGEIPFDLFLGGIRNSAVSFRRQDGAPVTGNLIFF